MNDDAKSAFRANVARTSDERRQVRHLVAAGRWKDAEPNASRSRAYASRRRALIAPGGAESISGSTEDFQRVSFLAEGADRSRSVGYVEVSDGLKAEIGTGFLVSPQLFLTNRHVIEDEAAARGTQVTFFRELDE